MSLRDRYNQLVEQHAVDAVRYFSQWNIPSNERDDLVQEAFLEAWKSLPTYREEAPLRHWFLTICRRTAWRLSQKHRKIEEQLVEQLPDTKTGDDGRVTARRHAIMQQLQRCISRLSEVQQEAVHLHFVMQLSEQEVADHLTLSKGTVHSRLRAARKLLQACIKANESE
ncbi:MAG: sigma-70 family RNA polymerase sigma factor [Deltaproteobacteria bacterium]|nr:MAG: sigma-70 family RNA polymerase sigma factor [Deltaproteobacteria bacterium]